MSIFDALETLPFRHPVRLYLRTKFKLFISLWPIFGNLDLHAGEARTPIKPNNGTTADRCQNVLSDDKLIPTRKANLWHTGSSLCRIDVSVFLAHVKQSGDDTYFTSTARLHGLGDSE